MNENLQVALIAGFISLVVSSIGILSSWLLTRSQSQQLEKHIRSDLTEKLVALRIESYPGAFAITEKIERRKEPQRILGRQELKVINGELRAWKTGIVSLVLSFDSLDAYYKLLGALGMEYGEKDGYTREQAEKIISARDQFRSSLRRDVGFLHAGAPQLDR
jgi:hypothetical protein